MSKFVKNTKIVAAMDPVLERAINMIGKDHAYTDLEKMLKSEDIDAVYIATPHHLHKPLIKQAFEAEKHVFCEKPLTISVGDAREILQLQKKHNNLKLGVNYQYRYDHNCFRLVSGVQTGILGQVYYANCNIFFSRNLDYFEQGPWRTKISTAGGGTLIIHGSHIIDIMIWALGDPISVMGTINTIKFKDIEVEDIGFGIVEFNNGIYAQINDSMIVQPKMRLFGDLVELQIFGEKGRCYYKGPWPFASLQWKGVKSYKVKKEVSGISNFSRCVKAFGNWVLHDTPFHNTVEQCSKVLCLIEALYKSSKSNKKESVEKL